MILLRYKRLNCLGSRLGVGAPAVSVLPRGSARDAEAASSQPHYVRLAVV
jgi:hypothetical protein